MRRRNYLAVIATGSLSSIAGCSSEPTPDKILKKDDLGGSWETRDEPNISEHYAIESAIYFNGSGYRRRLNITIFPCNGDAASEDCSETYNSFKSNYEEELTELDIGDEAFAVKGSSSSFIRFIEADNIVEVEISAIVTNEMAGNETKMEEQIPSEESIYEENLEIAEMQLQKLREAVGNSG